MKAGIPGGWPMALFVVAFSTAAFFFRAHGPEREETAIFAVVERLWQEAVVLGYDPDRKPMIAFVDDDTTPLAQTECLSPRPVIDVNRRYLAKAPQFVGGVAIPHEMAHVLVCLGGSREEWAQVHGPAWERAVRLLVERDAATDLITLQHTLDPPKVRPLSVEDFRMGREILEDEVRRGKR